MTGLRDSANVLDAVYAAEEWDRANAEDDRAWQEREVRQEAERAERRW